MRIQLDQIEDSGLAFDCALELGDLSLAPGQPIRVRRAQLAGQARRAVRGVQLQAHLAADLSIECSRCAELFDLPLSADCSLTLVGDGVEYGPPEAQLAEEDATLFHARDGQVDLADVAGEQIYLNLPLKPVCRPDCRGLCPSCGANRNRLECGCRQEAIDPRLAPLQRLKERMRGQ
jgi:uncharacterized protein